MCDEPVVQGPRVTGELQILSTARPQSGEIGEGCGDVAAEDGVLRFPLIFGF
jgi:hypothetical protein